MRKKTTLEYLEDKVLIGDHHWGWAGQKDRITGRARATVYIDGKRSGTPATRVLWELLKGPIPPGMTLAHQCGDVTCIRPDHMEPKPQRENLMESPTALATINANKTHCVNGHEFTPENTGRTYRGARRCRACEAERRKRKWQDDPEWAERQRAAHREWMNTKYATDPEWREAKKADMRRRNAR